MSEGGKVPEKVDSQLLKTINERRILNIIKEEAPISRNDLAKRVKISKAAVSSIITRLDLDGFILEIGKGESTSRGGKRPTLLKLNPDYGYVVGIQIKRGDISMAIADIESNIIDYRQFYYNIKDSIDKVLSFSCTVLDELFQKNKISLDKLVSIGIGIPGFIDYEKGELEFAVTLREWIHLPLTSKFSDRYGVPVSIENDVNLISLSESHLGAGKGYSNLALILIESGIGTGIILDGKVVQGDKSHAGEIGYLDLGDYINNLANFKNLYNNQRFFGEFLSDLNLYDALQTKLNVDPQFSSEEQGEISLKSLLKLGDNGNGVVQEVLNEFAYSLAVLCKNLIVMLNPSLLIISGHIIENSNYTYQKVLQFVKQGIINTPLTACPIVVGELKERAGVLGAISMALRIIFEVPIRTTASV